MTCNSHTAIVMRNDARSRARDLPSSLLDIPRSNLPSFDPLGPIATSNLDNHAMEPVLFAAVLMLFITKFTALTAVGVYFINS